MLKKSLLSLNSKPRCFLHIPTITGTRLISYALSRVLTRCWQLRLQQIHLRLTFLMQVLQILRRVWADRTIQPRVKTFAWRLLRLALGTASRIHRIVPNVDETCSRCGCIENEVHLFLSATMLGQFGSPPR